MTARDPKQLLGGYATDSLGEAERNELLRAALDDQELFDALVEEEGLRELLHDPAARQEVLAVLEQPTGWERVRAWFERPATLVDLAAIGGLAAAAVVGLALVTLRPSSDSTAARPTGAILSPAHVEALLACPRSRRCRPGSRSRDEPTRLSPRARCFRCASACGRQRESCCFWRRRAGAPSQAWPALGQAPALVPAQAKGGPAIVSAAVESPQAPGTQRLRLVVAPADLDLGALAPGALERESSRLTIVDLRYQVKQR